MTLNNNAFNQVIYRIRKRARNNYEISISNESSCSSSQSGYPVPRPSRLYSVRLLCRTRDQNQSDPCDENQSSFQVVAITSDLDACQASFTNYLATACPSVWTYPYTTSRPAASWPTTVVSATNSKAVASIMYANSTTYQPYAIGFADYASGAQLNAELNVRMKQWMRRSVTGPMCNSICILQYHVGSIIGGLYHLVCFHKPPHIIIT